MIEIDGSYGEGGGSIIRVALPLAYHVHSPVVITNIRAKRRNPGLQEQHLVGIKAFHQLVGGKLLGAEKGSTKITYYPPDDRENINTQLFVNIRTAGSISLLTQILQNTAFTLKKDFTVQVTGGATHGKWAPTIEYLQKVTAKFFEQIGLKLTIKIERYGFYPKGGAKAFIEFKNISPKKTSISLVNEVKNNLDTVEIDSIESLSLAQHLVGERQAKAARKILEDNRITTTSRVFSVPSISPGSGILIRSVNENNHFLGTDNIGEKGVRAEKVGEKPAKEFVELIKNDVNIDPHLSDQIILPIVFSNTRLKARTSEFTKHAETNAWLIRKFLPDKDVIFEKEKDFTGILLIN